MHVNCKEKGLMHSTNVAKLTSKHKPLPAVAIEHSACALGRSDDVSAALVPSTKIKYGGGAEVLDIYVTPTG